MSSFLMLFIILSSSAAFADEKITEYKNPAAMGRGDTTTTWSDSDVTNVFYNPALLSDKNAFSFELVNPVADVSTNSFGLLRHPPTNIQNNQLNSTFSPYFGNSYFVQGFASPSITYDGFTVIPYFATGAGSITLSDPVFSHANGMYYYDTGTALAKGFHLTDNLSVGASVILYHRHAAEEQVTLLNLLTPAIQYNLSGQALSTNLGATYQLHDSYQTTFGVNARNIGSPSFWNTQTNVPDSQELSTLQQEFDLGVSSSFFPVPYFYNKVKWAVEFHNISDSQYSFTDKLALGLQYNIFSWLNIKGGLYESFLTTGFGIDTKYVAIDLSYYGENSGVGYNTQNRHLILGLKLGFNL